MAAPGNPTGDPYLTGDELDFRLVIELSQAQVAALNNTANAIYEMPGTVNLDPDLFVNAMKVTVSCQPPWVPYP